MSKNFNSFIEDITGVLARYNYGGLVGLAVIDENRQATFTILMPQLQTNEAHEWVKKMEDTLLAACDIKEDDFVRNENGYIQLKKTK